MFDMLDWIDLLARVLASPKGRAWHRDEQIRSPMHPAVRDMLCAYRPRDWHLLVLEWPHVSRSDALRLAYTRSNEHGEIDRRTVTTIGKYLTRHFPDAPSNLIRDLAARYGVDAFSITRNMSEMQEAVRNGPESCMSKFNVGDDHPYSVYDPALGWGMALRKDGLGNVTGRALVWDDPDPDGDAESRFVRTYSSNTNSNGYSQADDGLKNWLTEQGYERYCSWEGTRLRYIKHPRHSDCLLMPYIDGSCQSVSHDMNTGTLYFDDDDGEYNANNTDGTAEAREDTVRCECCDDGVSESDIHSVGYNGDTQVCESCLNYNYVYVVGRRGDEYHVHADNAVWVASQDQHYDTNYLSSNRIVELDNGDYEHQDYAVYLDRRDIWVHMDDDDAVYCEHSDCWEHTDDVVQLHDGNYALTDDAWQCAHDDAWYLCDDVTAVDVKNAQGILIPVHPDHADEYAVEEDEEESN
jgi:hypothetical protein